jgi:GWxTD domain-containing protein
MIWRRTILLLLILVVAALAEQPQDVLKLKSRYGFKVERRQPINLNAFLDFGSDPARPVLYVSVAVLNDVIQFRKTENGYHAAYRISLALRSHDQSLLQKTEVLNVRIKDFKRTNSIREFQHHTFRLDTWPEDFVLKSGTYKVLLTIEDLTTRKSTHLKSTLNVQDYFSKRQHTSICFLRQTADSSAAFPLLALQRSIPFNKPVTAFAHIIADSTFNDTLTFQIVQKQNVLFKESFTAHADSGLITLRHPLPVERLREGTYRLEVFAGRQKLSRPFRVIWFQKPTYLYEYELAIRPMRYILPKAEYETIKALNHENLNEWFELYWKEKDPTPKTVFNELLFEFYQRVQEANRKFSTRNREGWETDRGRIYLLYGPPTTIENGRYTSQSNPYLVWKYANGQKFVFIDKNRNGEFTLMDTTHNQE